MPDALGNPLPGEFGYNNPVSLTDTFNTSFNPAQSTFGFQPATVGLPDDNGFFSLDNSIVNGTPQATSSFGAPNSGNQSGGWFDGFFSNDQGGQGWGSTALGAAQGVAQTWLGFQQLGQAKDQLNFQRNAWQQQFDIQKDEYDRRVSERNARVAANQANSNQNRNAAASSGG